jgi:hypothetical protein
MADVSGDLRHTFYRNHVHFTYKEKAELTGHGTFKNLDGGMPAREFHECMIEYLNRNCKYLWSTNVDGRHISFYADYDVYFESKDELERFMSHFLMLHKLAN